MSKNKGIKVYGDRAQIQNTLVYQDYYNRLKLLALSMFEWVNLPDTIDERYLEMTLFEKGQILFFKDNDLDCLFALQCTASAPLNIYNEPKKRRAYASNGYNKQRSSSTSILCYNNYLKTPTEVTIRLYAQRLAEIERSIDVNLNACKTPILIKCTENQIQTLRNLYSQYQGNTPVIFGDKDMNIEGMEVMNTKADYLADKFTVLKHSIWNDAMTFLGISNSQQDKKERMISDEVTANEEQIEMSREVMLNTRKEACEKINKMFNLNIDVRYRNTDMNIADKTMTREMEGDNE